MNEKELEEVTDNKVNKKTGSKSDKYEMDMCNGPILKKILIFTLPLMASSMLQLLFNAADVIVVGRFAGDNALAAVGSNGALVNFLVNFFMGLSIGANVLVARYYAAKKNTDLEETVHTAMLLSIISGIFINIVGVMFAKTVLVWMDTPKEVLSLAVIYLRIYFCGMTAMMIYNFGAAILRGVGDTRRPLYYLLFAGIINFGLNLFFVIVLNMSVAGVALATVISQCVSAGLILRLMFKEKGAVHLEIKKLRLYTDKVWGMLRIGLPASFQGILFSLSNIIIQASINGFGATIVAGNSAAANVESFVYMAMNAFSQAAISFAGQNYGAGKYSRIPKIAIRIEMSVIMVGLVFGNAVVLFGRPLLSLYTTSPKVIDAGMMRIHVVARTYFLCGMMDVMVGLLRGLGYSFMPMIVSLVGACGLRLLYIFTLFRLPQFHNITSLYLTYTVTWIITFIAHVICYEIIWNRVVKPKMK